MVCGTNRFERCYTVSNWVKRGRQVAVMARPTSRRGDLIGMGLSGLCLVHCVLLGPLLALLPLVGREFLPDWKSGPEWFHAVLLFPIIIVSGPVLLRGARSNPLIGVIGAAALVLIGGGLLVEFEVTERAMTITGSLLLVSAHLLNLHRKHRH